MRVVRFVITRLKGGSWAEVVKPARIVYIATTRPTGEDTPEKKLAA